MIASSTMKLAALGVAGTGLVTSAVMLSSKPKIVSSQLATIAALATPAPTTHTALIAASSNLGRLTAVQSIIAANSYMGAVSSTPTNGPVITVTSPGRGSFATTAVALVQGNLSDSVPVDVFTINGNPVTTDVNGNFSEPVSLQAGLNVIDVAATDSKSISNKVSLALLYGQFAPDNQNIGNGLAVRLNQGSFDAICRVVESKINGATISTDVQNASPFDKFNLPFSNTGEIDCTGASFGNPTMSLWPTPGALNVSVTIPSIYVGLSEVNTAWFVPNLSGNVTADSVTLNAQVAIAVNNGVVTTSIVNDSVSFQNFNFNLNGILGVIASIGPVQDAIKGAVQGAIAGEVKSKLPPEINKAIAGATGDPIKQTILHQTATFSLAPDSISIDGAGLNATVDANCSLSQVAGYTPLSAPGSLVTNGSAPTNGAGPDFFASINDDLLNRAGYAVWKSGVAQIRIDDSPSSAFQMPVGYPLDMALLQTFLPELVGVGKPGDPLALIVTPLLPPVFVAQPNPNTLLASLGELQLDFVDTVTNQPVITLALHTKATAKLTLNAQNTFDVHMSDRPTVDASLVSCAVSNINTIGIDNVMQLFAPTIIQIAGNQWSGFPLPTYPGLAPVKTSIYWDGAQESFVTAAGNWTAGGAALPTGNPAPISWLNPLVTALNPAIRNALLGAATTTVTGTGSSSSTTSGLASRLGTVAINPGLLGSLGVINGNGNNSTPSFASTVSPSIGYVAIVKDGLESAVTPLLAGYQARGTNCALISLSSIPMNYAGRDRAEQIRNWLVANCNDGVKRYLLLVGGPDVIPFRTCTPSAAVGNVVTDLYYGNLTGNWDSNNNGTYGEIGDQPLFDAQLYVGRLPFDDAQSVTTAVNAIEAARSQTNKGAWSNKCLLVGATTIVPGDDPIGASTAKAMAFDPNGWTTTTAFAPESFLKGDQVLDSNTIVNDEQADPVALMMTFSHGSTQGLMSHPDSRTWHDVLTIPQLAQFNKAQPPVEIAVACNTADPSGGPCIGSISLQNGLAGWVGCTVVTDPRSGAGAWLLATVQLATEVSQGKTLGVSLADTISQYVALGSVGVAGNDLAKADLYQQAMSWICYGDPGLSIGPNAH